MSEEAVEARSYRQLCGIATAFDLIGDRWAALIVRDLLLGPLRFGELAEGLPGIGTNTLTSRLKHLESSEIVRRRLLESPDRGTVYELTGYGHELEPALLALGRWGAPSMGRLPADVAIRSRWLVAAMLAFHDQAAPPRRTFAWELRLTDGPFSVTSQAGRLTISAGPAAAPDAVVVADDASLHRLLTGQLSATEAVASGAVSITGADPALLEELVDLFPFPALGA